MNELSRQLVHLSGALFIGLAQVMSGLAAALTFFLIALTFLLYSLYIRQEQTRFRRLLHALDARLRPQLLRFERPGVPFQGAIWFYAACGLAFLIFPHPVATAATLILAVSDSLSTIVGHELGRWRLIGKKTVEGTLTFFLSALAVGLALLPAGAAAAAVAATAGELLPELAPSLRQRGLLDDNLTIPLLAGTAFLLAG